MADSGSTAQDRSRTEGAHGESTTSSASHVETQGVESSLRQLQVGSPRVDGEIAGTGESQMELGEGGEGSGTMEAEDAPVPAVGGMGYLWSEEVADSEARGPRENQEHEEEEEEEAGSIDLSEEESETNRGREQRRGSDPAKSPRRPRAPPCERKPSERVIRRFLSDAFTLDALYPGLSRDGSLPDYVQYLPDEITGDPQHSYECERTRVHAGAEPCHWMGQGPNDPREHDKGAELRWEGVQHRVQNLGHETYPRLLPSVTVPITSLPHDRITRREVQMLYIAWMQAGMRCPVKGCEPWAALDAPPKALPQPQALYDKPGRFTRSTSDSTRMDPVIACGPATKSFREHGMRGLELVVEHWNHFHMRRGKCFAAPCCSKTPAQDLGAKCQKRAFNSVTDAVEHLVNLHGDELKRRQSALAKEKDERASSWKRKQRADHVDVDPSDLRSVAQMMVHEMMEVYASRIGIPRTVGRGRWHTTVLLTRVTIGFHLQFLDLPAQQWEEIHIDWLENCKVDFVKWTNDVHGYGEQPPPLKTGSDAALRKPAKHEDSRKTPASGSSSRRAEPRASGAKPPPVAAIPPHRPIMEMLRKQFAASSPAGASARSTPSGGSSEVAAKRSSAPHTVTSSSTYTAQEKDIASAVTKAVTESTRGSTREKSREKTPSSSGTKSKRDRTESTSPGGQRKRQSRVGAQGLTAELRESGAKWQDRAVRAEEDLRKLQHRYKVLDDDSRASLTRWESERTQLMAKKTAAEAEADRYKTAAEEADEECVRACKDREELAAKLEEETAERSKLGALVKKLQEEAEALQKQVDVQEDELQTLRRSTSYVVPNGRLKLAHLPSYSEVVWASKGTQEEHRTATPEERDTAWRAVTEAFRDQHRDVAAAWQFVEDEHAEYPDMDVYGALYRTTKMAVEAVTSSLVQQLGQRLTGVRAGNSLATDLVGLQARSQARIEVYP